MSNSLAPDQADVLSGLIWVQTVAKVISRQQKSPLAGKVKENEYTFREGNSVKFVLLPSEKGYTLNWKNLLPFPVDPFSEGIWCAGQQTRSHKSCLPCKKWWKINPSRLMDCLWAVVCVCVCVCVCVVGVGGTIGDNLHKMSNPVIWEK